LNLSNLVIPSEGYLFPAHIFWGIGVPRSPGMTTY
jgi:hypothetical protein